MCIMYGWRLRTAAEMLAACSCGAIGLTDTVTTVAPGIVRDWSLQLSAARNEDVARVRAAMDR